MFYMPNKLLKNIIDGIHVPQLQPSYIQDKNHPSHTFLVEFCCDENYMWWRIQELETQEWEDFINYKKAIIML